MATLTIRKVDDETADKLKSIAKAHNRSVEAEVRSVLEDYTAGFLAHHVMSNADLVQEMWDLLGDNALGEDEEFVPKREGTVRPVDL